MEKSIASALSEQIISGNSRLNDIAGQIKEKSSEPERDAYYEKISHIMTLSFDILDMLGKEYPELNPYE